MKTFQSDSITSKLNKFKSDSRVKRPNYDYEEKRHQYCELVYNLYNEAVERNDFQTLLDRQARLLHSTEINNNILIGLVGGLAVGQISTFLDEMLMEFDINIIARIIILAICVFVLVISVIWIYSKLYDSMIAGYKFDNKFGTVTWELKFLEDNLRNETLKTMEKIRIETANDNENSETITDNKIE